MTTDAAEVVNSDQKAAWDGPEGDHWTEHEERYEAVGRALDAHLFAAADLTAGQDVLDVGCGCGGTTREAARRVAPGQAVGVDLSRRMLERARERAAGMGNAQFLRADAQVHRFDEGSFDVVISRYGSMFFAEPVAAFSHLRTSLKPGGRLVLLTWAALAENRWLTAVRESLASGRVLPEPPTRGPGALGLSDPDVVHDVLGRAGFLDVGLRAIREPLWFGRDAEHALLFMGDLGMARGLLADLGPEARAEALQQLREVLRRHETPAGVLLASCSWLVTARRG